MAKCRNCGEKWDCENKLGICSAANDQDFNCNICLCPDCCEIKNAPIRKLLNWFIIEDHPITTGRIRKEIIRRVKKNGD